MVHRKSCVESITCNTEDNFFQIILKNRCYLHMYTKLIHWAVLQHVTCCFVAKDSQTLLQKWFEKPAWMYYGPWTVGRIASWPPSNTAAAYATAEVNAAGAGWMLSWQMAALFCLKQHHGCQLESMMSYDYIKRCIYTWRTIPPNFIPTRFQTTEPSVCLKRVNQTTTMPPILPTERHCACYKFLYYILYIRWLVF